MFAIEEDKKAINGKFVKTFARTVKDHNTELDVEAGTTGYSGTPCRKAGGRTYMRLVCWDGDFHIDPITDEEGNPFGVEIACCGDAALDAFIKALEFACEAINDQRFDVDD